MRIVSQDNRSLHRASQATIFLILAVAIGIVFYITGNKVNQYGASDSLLSLPTSQTLWQTGHVYLDQHANRVINPNGKTLAELKGNYRVFEAEKGTVDYFPAGPAILTLPLTALLTSFNYDFINPDVNLAVQNRLSFLSASIALLLIFLLARLWHPKWESLVISLLIFFGSIIFSTMGSAFWSINYTTIFNLAIVILLSAKATIWQDDRYQIAVGVALGILIFLSFFCRVSSVAIVASVLAFLALTDFKQAVITGVSALTCLILFAAWSWAEYDMILPPYYALNRLNDAPVPMWVGLYGNLLSPSRGVLVFMPWLIIPLGWSLFNRTIWRNRLIQFAAFWFVLQLIIASRAVIWWGGGSFGPRLMVEATPSLILFTFIVWKEIKEKVGQPTLLAGGFTALAFLAIWMHSWQAFFNPYTGGHWYDVTPAVVGDAADDLGPYFDWRYAQWRSNDTIVCELETIHFAERIIPFENSLEPLELNVAVTSKSDTAQGFNERAMFKLLTGDEPPQFAQGEGNLALFEGMYFVIGQSRWSACPEAKIHFVAGDSLEPETLVLNLKMAALQPQNVALQLNGNRLASIEVGRDMNDFQIEFPADYLSFDSINSLNFTPSKIQEPNLARDGFDYTGPIGVSFSEMKISSP